MQAIYYATTLILFDSTIVWSHGNEDEDVFSLSTNSGGEITCCHSTRAPWEDRSTWTVRLVFETKVTFIVLLYQISANVTTLFFALNLCKQIRFNKFNSHQALTLTYMIRYPVFRSILKY